MVATLLDGVEGLGPKRRERLMLELGSLENLRGATLEELRAPRVAARRRRSEHLRSIYAPPVRHG